MKKIPALCLIVFCLFIHSASADIGEALSWTASGAVDAGMDLGYAGIDLVKFLGGALWLAGEVLIFPFRFLER